MQKTNKTTPLRSPLFGVGAGAGKTGRGMKLWGLPRGIRPGGRPGLPPRLLPVPPGAPPRSRLPEPPLRSALISGHSAGSLGEEGTVRGGQSRRRRERPGRPELLPAVCSRPASAPAPPPQTGVRGSPGPGDSAPSGSRFRTPATESDASARFACDLHTSATPTPPQLQTLSGQRM